MLGDRYFVYPEYVVGAAAVGAEWVPRRRLYSRLYILYVFAGTTSSQVPWIARA